MYDTCRLFVVIFLAAMLQGQVARAEPISIRGVNWAMSKAEQVSALEKQDLTCVQEIGWNAFYPTREGISSNQPTTICIDGAKNEAAIGLLRASFQEWTKLCDVRDARGYVTNECLGFNKFQNLKKSLIRVWYKDDGAIIFDCSFVNTCGFDGWTVVSQLQAKVIQKKFTKPTENSWIICANGDDGDSLCVHGHSRDIWLLKKPFVENMKF